eukprot:gene21627-28633_t
MLRLQQEFSAANIDRIIKDAEDLIPIDGVCNAIGGCYAVDEKEDDAANIGMIVGIVMGCVIGIPIFVWVIWCLYRCCQEKRTSAAVKATYKDNPMYSTQNNVLAHNGSYNHPSDGGKKYPQEAANQGHPGAYQVQHTPGVHDPYPRGSVHSNCSHPYASSPHRALSVPNQEELNRQYYSGCARVNDPYGQLQPQRSYALASQAASNRANSNTASPLAMQGWNRYRQGSHLSSYSAGGAPPDHVWSSRNNSAGPLRNLGGEQASAANHVIDYPLNAAPGPAPTATMSLRRVSWAAATSAPPAGGSQASSQGVGNFNSSLGGYGSLSARGSQGGANLNSSIGGYGNNSKLMGSMKRTYSGVELVGVSSGSLSQSLQPNLNQDLHAPLSRLRY